MKLEWRGDGRVLEEVGRHVRDDMMKMHYLNVLNFQVINKTERKLRHKGL